VTGQTSVLTTRVPGQPAEPASQPATSIASQDQAPDFSRAAAASQPGRLANARPDNPKPAPRSAIPQLMVLSRLPARPSREAHSTTSPPLDSTTSTEGRYLHGSGPRRKMSGGVLLSHAVPRAVPSALKGLTSGFGMGPGVSPSPWPPKLYGDVTDRISGTAQWTQTKYEVEAKPLGLLVPVSYTRCRASTSGLSTQSSTGGLTGLTPRETSS
jgi:hypothetical protein